MSQNISTALGITLVVAPIVLSVGFTGLLLWLTVTYRVQIGKAIGATANALYKNYTSIIKYAREKLLTRSAYFRYGILVCMVVSIIHGSHLFATQENIPILNYLEIAVFDIGTYALVEGLISTRKKGYVLASICILLTILQCTLL
jgi:hypothetical protein